MPFLLWASTEFPNVDALGGYEDDRLYFSAFSAPKSDQAFRSSAARGSLDFLPFSVERAAFEHRFGEVPADETRWFQLKVGPKGDLPMVLGLDGPGPSLNISTGSALSDSALGLMHTTIDEVLLRRQRNEDLLRDGLESLSGRRLSVVAIDVGQGSLAALVDPGGYPALFFDLGWPLNFNAATRPHLKPNLDRLRAPVVLSHWDWDHWALAIHQATWVGRGGSGRWRIQWESDALDRPWLVPGIGPLWGDVSIGAAHMALAFKLASMGHLFVWPASVKEVVTSHFTVTRTAGGPHKSVNQNGLAMVVHDRISDPGDGLPTDPDDTLRAVLLPGDADYPFIPYLTPGTTAPFRYQGLLATHHGGRFSATTSLVAEPHGVLVASCGHTSYGHPKQDAQITYLTEGWRHQALTRNRLLSPMAMATGDCPRGNAALSTADVRDAGGLYPTWDARQ